MATREETQKSIPLQLQAVPKNLNVKHCIIVMSGKGGVGKSTISVNLAVTLSRAGHSVGLFDADLTSPSIPRLLGVKGHIGCVNNQLVPVSYSKNLKVLSTGFLIPSSDCSIIWRGGVKMGAIRQFINDTDWGSLDFMVVDLPPGTGDEPLSIAQELKPDGALIVTTPQEVALTSSRKSVDFAQKLGVPVIGIVENMSGYTCPTCHTHVAIFKAGGGERSAKELGVPFICRIPLDVAICESGDRGAPILDRETEDSRSIKCIDAIVNRVLSFYDNETDVSKRHSL
ncbi:MAG: Mrp/NBP35 family ATP-binding protein [Halobacteriota archaeon]